MAVAGGPDIVESGLVLCLDAGNSRSYPGSGTAWNDLSGRGINGTLTNGPVYSTDKGGVMVFDGTDDYVSLPNDIADISADWTIEAFVNVNDDNNPRIMSLITTLDNLQVGYMQTSMVPYIRIDNSTVIGSVGLTAGSWLYLVYQVSSSVRKIFINCVPISTSSGGITGNGLFSAVGGGSTATATYPTNGKIAIARLYNRALTDSELQQNFNATRGRFGI